MTFPLQFIQHTAGAQERTHPQICSRELLFFDEKGELFESNMNFRAFLSSVVKLKSISFCVKYLSILVFQLCPIVSHRFQISMACWIMFSQTSSSTPTRRREQGNCCSKCAKASETCFTPALKRWVSFQRSRSGQNTICDQHRFHLKVI